MDEVRFPPFAAAAENQVTDGDSYHVARQLSARINHVWSRRPVLLLTRAVRVEEQRTNLVRWTW